MKIRQIAEKTAKIIGCTAVLALFPALSGEKAAAEPIGAEVSVGYDTDYVFRGTLLGEDLLWSDVNVSSTLTDGIDLGVGVWYANPTSGGGGDELDVYAGLSTSMGEMSVDLGGTYYYYPVDGGNTLEFGLGLGASAGPFDLSLGIYYDIDLESAYYEVGASTSFDLTDTMSVDVGANIGDADGDTLSFMWTALGHDLEVSNPSSSMADLVLPSRSLSSPSQVISESYSFELEVSDCNAQNSDTSQVTVSYTCRRAQ